MNAQVYEAVANLTGGAAYYRCLLLVHRDVGKLKAAAEALVAAYGWPRLRVGLEVWLLACALRAHPAEELPFADLVRLPELFPFRLTARVEDLRQRPGLAVQRQGSGWDMVRTSPSVFPQLG